MDITVIFLSILQVGIESQMEMVKDMKDFVTIKTCTHKLESFLA